MQIILTSLQWENLKALVSQGDLATKQLGLPVEIKNSDQAIEIEADEVKITLDD